MHRLGIGIVAMGLILLIVICSVTFAQDQDQTLIEAAKRGDLKQVQYLLDNRVDVNARNNKGTVPLMLAAIHGHSDVVKLLLDRGADVNAKNNKGATALIWASFWLLALP